MEPQEAEQSADSSRNTVVVSGVPTDVLPADRMSDKLIIHFQSRRSSAGGDVQSVRFPTNTHGVAFITFVDGEDAEKVVRKRPQIMADEEFPEEYELTVFPFSEDVFFYVSNATLDLSLFDGDHEALLRSLRSRHRSIRFGPLSGKRTALIEGPFTAAKALREELICRAARLQKYESRHAAVEEGVREEQREDDLTETPLGHVGDAVRFEERGGATSEADASDSKKEMLQRQVVGEESALTPPPAADPPAPPQEGAEPQRLEGQEGAELLRWGGRGGAEPHRREGQGGAEPHRREGQEGAEPHRWEGMEGAEPHRREGQEGAELPRWGRQGGVEPHRRGGQEGAEPHRREGTEGAEPHRREGKEGAEPHRREGQEGAELPRWGRQGGAELPRWGRQGGVEPHRRGGEEGVEPHRWEGQEGVEPHRRGGQEGVESHRRGGQEGAEPHIRGGQEGVEPHRRGGQEGAEPHIRGGQEGVEPHRRGGQEGVEPLRWEGQEGVEPHGLEGKEGVELPRWGVQEGAELSVTESLQRSAVIGPEEMWVDLMTFRYVDAFQRTALDACLGRVLMTHECFEESDLVRVCLCEAPPPTGRSAVEEASENLQRLFDMWQRTLTVHQLRAETHDHDKLRHMCIISASLYDDVLHTITGSEVKIIGPSPSSYKFYRQVRGGVSDDL